MTENIFVRLKDGQQAAICVGEFTLYPSTDFSHQDYIRMDANDQKVKEDIKYHKKVLNVRKTRPEEPETKKKQNDTH